MQTGQRAVALLRHSPKTHHVSRRSVQGEGPATARRRLRPAGHDRRRPRPETEAIAGRLITLLSPPSGQGADGQSRGDSGHWPVPAGYPHDGLSEPCPFLERNGALAPGAEGTGKARERPAAGDRNQAVASELPHQPEPGTSADETPARERKESTAAANRTGAVTACGDVLILAVA